MQIHRTKKGETAEAVAKEYETTKERIEENNSLDYGIAAGRELLILKPTRTYVARAEDTLRDLARRFRVKEEELLLNNPSLLSDAPLAGRELAIKYAEPTRASVATNGYYFKSTGTERLKAVLPFVTYLTVSAYRLCERGLERIFDPRAAVRMGKEGGKVVLMRVYDGTDGEVYTREQSRSELIETLIGTAGSGGYAGITLSAHTAAKNRKDDLTKFIVELRRSMIGSGLILFTEVDEDTPRDVSELADGSVFMYEKAHLAEPPSFENGERAVLEAFSSEAESSKVFIDLPCEGYVGGSSAPLKDVFRAVRSDGGCITANESTLISGYSASVGEIRYNSLENIKARLDLAYELGFMGLSFDIGAVPTEYLMMIFSLFTPVHFYSPFSLPT